MDTLHDADDSGVPRDPDHELIVDALADRRHRTRWFTESVATHRNLVWDRIVPSVVEILERAPRP